MKHVGQMSLLPTSLRNVFIPRILIHIGFGRYQCAGETQVIFVFDYNHVSFCQQLFKRLVARIFFSGSTPTLSVLEKGQFSVKFTVGGIETFRGVKLFGKFFQPLAR